MRQSIIIDLSKSRKGNTMAVEINWDNFSLYNNGPDGLRTKFENLCRQLFANEYLSGNRFTKHLHSNPNNPGIESEPILDESSNQYVGYQAKFFERDVDYAQILHSMEEAVKYYDGKLDRIVLYCNKAITSTCAGYSKIVGFLEKTESKLNS